MASNIEFAFFVLLLPLLYSSVHCQGCATWDNYTVVCYPDLECFDNCFPFDFLPTPESPEAINTTFLLYTFAGQTEPETITETNFGSFKTDAKTRYIAHGFEGHPRDPWILEIKEAFLSYRGEESNVVVIDWSEGANPDWSRPTEPVPASNSRVVARQTRNLIRAIEAETGYSNDLVHCVGHSVGGQLCAYVGQEFTADPIGRISALDPAGLDFDTVDPTARLSPDDAQFVDVIHTDTSGFSHSGTTINGGHVDFWPNKGVDQPGCSGNVCSHFRGQAYYTESLLTSACTFISDKCDSLEDVQEDLCYPCSGLDCQVMGFHSIEYRGTGTYTLTTNADTPYCIE